MLLAFEGIARPVDLTGCGDLIPVMDQVLRDWPFRRMSSPSPSPSPPVIAVLKTAAGYERRSPWLSEPAIYKDPANAVCDLIVDLVNAHMADNPSLLCLHAAAVEMGDGLVLFPSAYKTGKSTLSVHLAASGARVFADDILTVSAPDNQGIALGVQPRLRLPLPDDREAAFDRFLESRPGPASKRFLYVDLAKNELAPFGASSPVRGVVLLQRDDKEEPALVPADMGEVVKSTILRNISRTAPAMDILDRLHGIVQGAGCFTLTYGNTAQAVQLLTHAFDAGRRGRLALSSSG